MGLRMEFLKRGKIIQRGKGSMAIPLSAEFARDHCGGAKVGDEWEIYVEDGKLYLKFPKPQPAPPPSGGAPF